MTPIKSKNALRAMLILEEFGLPMSIVPETGYELYLPLFGKLFHITSRGARREAIENVLEGEN